MMLYERSFWHIWKFKTGVYMETSVASIYIHLSYIKVVAHSYRYMASNYWIYFSKVHTRLIRHVVSFTTIAFGVIMAFYFGVPTGSISTNCIYQINRRFTEYLQHFRSKYIVTDIDMSSLSERTFHTIDRCAIFKREHKLKTQISSNTLMLILDHIFCHAQTYIFLSVGIYPPVFFT